MKNFLITGGAGFIGSTVAERLLNNGDKVVVIDNFNEFYDYNIKIRNILEITNNFNKINEFKNLSKEEKINKLIEIVNSENFTLVYGDIRDREAMDRVFAENSFDLVFNPAAMAGVRPSLLDPMLYEDVNVRGYMNLLELCKKYGVKKFIQASSSSVYGNNKEVPFKETAIVDFAISPYAATKKSCEVMGHVYHKLYNIDMVQLRFFTVYGPKQRPDLAIHKFTKMILEDKPIPFYGDGTTKRDYTYIDDIVDGILKSMNYLFNNENVYEIFNLGESHVVSLKEMVETIESALGKKAILDIQPMQPGDVDKTYADISKAKAMIGYDPQTNFSEGIRKFVEWYKRQ
ncbi:MAG: GDP-mannose 4,6-dehydratase [Fusobacterium sp.]|uniref:GDP-mannose 4,6-dehydratase n=1 Tax=Fusobacterium sp. TaxID=68766 RepID=UPI002943D3FC|nr:GDP-mannose 4,6-dehydratase [Fusobacterium sp.]MDY3059639.1 GDP-mannose 4,6-dehydratase [Fusobacterium sp.]MEE1475079.1 GDP-mannose 4,6-dehydratase [Fusobacterium sp.]